MCDPKSGYEETENGNPVNYCMQRVSDSATAYRRLDIAVVSKKSGCKSCSDAQLYGFARDKNIEKNQYVKAIHTKEMPE